MGIFSQEPGAIEKDDGTLGNCVYGDKETLVRRNLTGDYAYCQGGICDHVFVGGFRSLDYDPRFRPWYTKTKALQRPNWSPPYPFFDDLAVGITYSVPFYTEDASRRKVFRGIFSVDYALEDINRFLVNSYGSGADKNDETYVVIFEAASPNYLIAASTGRSVASRVWERDESTPCPPGTPENSGCIVKRVTMEDLAGSPNDEILRASYMEQRAQEYPRALVSARLSDTPGADAFVSQSSYYSSGDDLEWVILVISPVEISSGDSLTGSDDLFGLVCAIAGIGFVLCLAMFLSFYFKRKSKAVILADWRFTSAFLLGCTFLNLTTYVFLGYNTAELCLARMWAFHLMFALTLSPLFVKVWRLYLLVGTHNRNPAIISNPKAVAMTMPIVLIQVAILVAFSIVDPPVPQDIIEVDGAVATQTTECTTNTQAFTYTVFAFECSLVLIGCVLAFLTRNMQSGFGQSKELMFSMYNIALIGVVIAVITFTVDIDRSGQIVLFSVGIFFGTVFSSAVFVLPRLLQTNQTPQVVRKSTTPSKQRTPYKKQSHVEFSQRIDIIGNSEHQESDVVERERTPTGWSAVEDEEDNASGLKSAGVSVLCTSDDGTRNDGASVWTQVGVLSEFERSDRDATEDTTTNNATTEDTTSNTDIWQTSFETSSC